MTKLRVVVGVMLAAFLLVNAPTAFAEPMRVLNSPIPPPLPTTVNSWFDHNSPGSPANNNMTKFNGQVWTDGSASLANCTLTVNCYDSHSGVDFNTNNGVNQGSGYPIATAAPGVVTEVTPSTSGLGNRVRIWHSFGGYSTLYAHLQGNFQVQVGQFVWRGHVVGYSGCSGFCIGAHLHFEVNKATGEPIDPYGWSGGGADPWPHNIGFLWTTNPPSTQPSHTGAVTNMLRNASGEEAAIGPWTATTGDVVFLNNTPTPKSGNKLIHMAANSNGGSVYQNVFTNTPNDSYYVFSLWARTQSGCVNVSVVVYGFGGVGTEVQQTNVNPLCTTWKYITAPGDFAYAHTSIRVEFVIPAGQTIFMDATELVPTKNMNASFEHAGKVNGNYWNRIQSTTGWGIFVGASKSGNRYMRTERLIPDSSPDHSKIWDDIPVIPMPGESYTFSAWLKAPAGAETGFIRIHTLGPIYEKTDTWFVIDGGWKQWSATLEPLYSGHTGLRVEVYFLTQGFYDIDGTQVVQNLLSKSSFESGAGPAPWHTFEPSPQTFFNVLQPSGSSQPRDGPKHLQMWTIVNDGSVYQDLPVTAIVNKSYSFVIWLRCVAPCPPDGVDGAVKLVALPNETSVTYFDNIFTSWTPVVATIDVTGGGPMLRAQIHMEDENYLYDVDATGNSIGIAPNW